MEEEKDHGAGHLAEIVMAMMVKRGVKELLLTKSDFDEIDLRFPGHALVVQGTRDLVEVSIMHNKDADSYFQHFNGEPKNLQ